MSLFAISDVHLSLGTDKPMDIFKGWENYVQRLEKNWRLIVGQDDTVVLNGDISWALKLEETIEDFTFLNALPGKKLILKGNHDLWWNTMQKMRSFMQEKHFDTIEFVHNNAVAVGSVCVCGTRGWFFDGEKDQKILLRERGRLEASIVQAEQTGLEPVAFLHYPPLYDQKICEEIMEVLIRHNIKRCFFGHIHGPGARRGCCAEYQGISFRLVSADANGFRPILVEK